MMEDIQNLSLLTPEDSRGTHLTHGDQYLILKDESQESNFGHKRVMTLSYVSMFGGDQNNTLSQ